MKGAKGEKGEGESRHGKKGGIWAPGAQKDSRLQKDFANSNSILLEIVNGFVENFCQRRISASERGNFFCRITY